MKRLCNLIIILFSSLMFAQDNFPLNGVKETNQIYHAFINVDIMINYKDKIDNATLLIKGSEILEVGSKVKHIKFGEGEIISLEEDGVNKKAIISFKMFGVKKLLLRFAKLQLL